MSDKVTQGPAIPEPSADVLALLKTVQALKENVEILTGMRSKNVKGVGEQLIDIRSQTAGANARFVSYVEVSTNADEALVRRTDTLEAEYKAADVTLDARVTTVDTARADGDEALAQSVQTLDAAYKSADTGVLSAATAQVQHEALARANADGALASDITTVTATANSGTASGQIAIRANAGLFGVSASFGVFLTAQAPGGVERSAGLYIVADTDGLARIAFSAGQFTFYDNASGGVKTVFDYVAGQFTLNGNVTLNGNLVITGSVNTPQLALNAATSGAGVYVASGAATTALSVKSSASIIMVEGTYDGAATRYPFGTVTPGQLQLVLDGGVELGHISVGFAVEGNNDNRSVGILPTTIRRAFTLDSLGIGATAGVHTFQVNVGGSGTQVGGLNVSAVEYIR